MGYSEFQKLIFNSDFLQPPSSGFPSGSGNISSQYSFNILILTLLVHWNVWKYSDLILSRFLHWDSMYFLSFQFQFQWRNVLHRSLATPRSQDCFGRPCPGSGGHRGHVVTENINETKQTGFYVCTDIQLQRQGSHQVLGLLEAYLDLSYFDECFVPMAVWPNIRTTPGRRIVDDHCLHWLLQKSEIDGE